MSARDDVFANIRRSLGVTGAEAARKTIVEQRMADAPKGVIPRRGQVEDRVGLFAMQAESAHASVARVKTASDVPIEIARFLRESNLPATLRMGADPRLDAMPWATTMLETSHGRSDGNDINAVSHAFGGVAESGTLILVSGADNPTTLNFLPDNHIVVVRAADIAGDYESVWARLRLSFGKGRMPRTVNMVTGPSRSGDIEQKLLLGAHGPRRLHIVVIEAET